MTYPTTERRAATKAERIADDAAFDAWYAATRAWLVALRRDGDAALPTRVAA